jgi:hypothetical protein
MTVRRIEHKPLCIHTECSSYQEYTLTVGSNVPATVWGETTTTTTSSPCLYCQWRQGFDLFEKREA